MKTVAAAACIVEMKAVAAVAYIAETKAAAVGIVEMKAGIVVVVGVARTVDVVSRVELKPAAGIGALMAVAVASRVELRPAAVVCTETTKAAAVAGVLLDILRPHAGTGDTGLEQKATGCVAPKVVAGLIGEFGFVAIRAAKVNLQLGNTVPQADNSDLFEPDPGHRYTVEY
jgi:hypothetical protein